MEEEIELWKDIPFYENFYQVSSLGRIRSKGRAFQRLKYLHKYKAKILSPVFQKSHPYLTIRLNDGDSTKGFLIHRLVAIAFLINPLNKKEVNHKDGNCKNNKISNLEWVTASENIKHAFKIGSMKPKKGEDNPRSKLTNLDVIDIKILIKAGYDNKFISKIWKVSSTVIYTIKTNKQWSHITL